MASLFMCASTVSRFLRKRGLVSVASRASTSRQVLHGLNLHRLAVRLLGRGELPAFRVGGSWRFLRSTLDDWFKRGIGATAKRSGRGRGSKVPRG